MNPRLLVFTITAVLATRAACAESSVIAHPVTATPPLQAVPATPLSKSVQQRMRGCNAAADGKKLMSTARETFIKGCMTPRRRAGSHPGSQPKPNP